jgi:hypothetical protein
MTKLGYLRQKRHRKQEKTKSRCLPRLIRGKNVTGNKKKRNPGACPACSGAKMSPEIMKQAVFAAQPKVPGPSVRPKKDK